MRASPRIPPQTLELGNWRQEVAFVSVSYFISFLTFFFFLVVTHLVSAGQFL